MHKKHIIPNIVSQLFSSELAGDNWKKYTKETLLDILEQRFKESITGTDVQYIQSQKLLKKLKKADSVPTMLTILNESLFTM